MVSAELEDDDGEFKAVDEEVVSDVIVVELDGSWKPADAASDDGVLIGWEAERAVMLDSDVRSVGSTSAVVVLAVLPCDAVPLLAVLLAELGVPVIVDMVDVVG